MGGGRSSDSSSQKSTSRNVSNNLRPANVSSVHSSSLSSSISTRQQESPSGNRTSNQRRTRSAILASVSPLRPNEISPSSSYRLRGGPPYTIGDPRINPLRPSTSVPVILRQTDSNSRKGHNIQRRTHPSSSTPRRGALIPATILRPSTNVSPQQPRNTRAQLEIVKKSKVPELATQAKIDEFLSKHANILTVLDFYAEWCLPCRDIAKLLEDLTDVYTNKVAFAKINVEDHEDFALKMGVTTLPCLMFQKGANRLELLFGKDLEKIRTTVEKYVNH